MENRQEGYYWVQKGNTPQQIARYWGNLWYITGAHGMYFDKDFSYISPDPIPMEQEGKELRQVF